MQARVEMTDAGLVVDYGSSGRFQVQRKGDDLLVRGYRFVSVSYKEDLGRQIVWASPPGAKFPTATWTTAAEAAPGPRRALHVGDRVRWTSADEDVPVGTVGTVEVHLEQVRFPNGAWAIPQSQLEVVADD